MWKPTVFRCSAARGLRRLRAGDAKGCPQTPLDPIADHRFAQPFGRHKPIAIVVAPVGQPAEHEVLGGPRLAVAPYRPEVFRAAQT